LANNLDKSIESKYFKYVLEHKAGIYYVYGSEIYKTPKIFSSKESNSYLSAIELLTKYENSECKRQLKFITKWLKENMIKNNKWDMGKESKDGINFPLSDSWKTEENRIKDCTYRINKLLEKI
jgi:hypothetical protein